MAKPDAENTFVLVKDSKGIKYLCPINVKLGPLAGHPDEIDNGSEEELVGRYAGNLNRKPS